MVNEMRYRAYVEGYIWVDDVDCTQEAERVIRRMCGNELEIVGMEAYFD